MCQPLLYSRLPCTCTFRRSLAQLLQAFDGLFHFLLHTHNADQILHQVLQDRDAPRRGSRRLRDRTAPALRARILPPARCSPPRPNDPSPTSPRTAPRDDRTPTDPKASCRPDDWRRAIRRRIRRPRTRPGNLRHLRLRIDLHTAHHVVRSRAHFHRFFRDVDVTELLELVIHARQLALNVIRRVRQSVP